MSVFDLRPSLEALQLRRAFGSGQTLTPVLRGVSLELFSGEFALVMGPSGSGKSTLLAIVSGLLRPDAGQVLVNGRDLWAMTDAERREFRLKHFGFIFQGFNLFPELTAREQLEMVLRWGEGTSRRDARVRAEEMLDLLGLGPRMNLLPAQLSGGEKQRVAIGRALVKRPRFVFADEPTSALDWGHGKHVVELLADTAMSNGATVFVVAHDNRIAPFAQRVCHMKDGSLIDVERTPLLESLRVS
jgi:putative ABC transport system ATP-binding protein